MSARVLFIIGGALLGAFVVLFGARSLLGQGGVGVTPTPEPTPTAFGIIVMPVSSLLSGPISLEPPPTQVVGATAEPQETPITSEPGPAPTVLVQADWPPSMAEGSSDTVVIWLIQTREKVYVAKVEREGQTAVPATLVPRGTPDVPYAESYGPGYKLVSASAVLTSTNIDVAMVSDSVQEYPLEEAKIGWQWSVSPRKQGKQVMTAEVRFRWESETGEPPRELPIWQYTLDTVVGPPMGLGAVDLTISSGGEAAPSNAPNEQVGFWADALQVVTGLGAIVAFAGGAVRWGMGRAKGVGKAS